MNNLQQQYNELCFYTLAQANNVFIHQHVADAFTAQTATDSTKPIAIVFSLAGLYLLNEKNYTGKEVQLAHMKMAEQEKKYSEISLPLNRGRINVADVLDAEPGIERNEMIYKWCKDVWIAYSDHHETISDLTCKLLRI